MTRPSTPLRRTPQHGRIRQHRRFPRRTRRAPRPPGRIPMAPLRAHRVPLPGRRRDLGIGRARRRVPAQALPHARGHRGVVLAPRRRRHHAAPCFRHGAAAARGLRARGGGGRRGRRGDGPLAPRRGRAAAAGLDRRAHPGDRVHAAVPALVRPGQPADGAAGRLRLGVPDRDQQLERREGGEGDLGARRAGDGRRRPAPVPEGDPARRAAVHLHRAAPGPRAGLAHPGRGRDARRRALGPRLADLRRARVPRHRRDARGHSRHRRHRPRAGEARVRAARALHGRALGDDEIVSDAAARKRSSRRAAAALVLVAAGYEALARSGVFPAVLLPPLPTIARTLAAMTADGSLPRHALYTLERVLAGLGLAVAVGLPLGILMARFRAAEHFLMPLVSVLMPIPSLAWVPLFILWFGLGNVTTVLVVFYAATFPMLLNTWSGVRAVNPLWLRAAGSMGARGRALFWKVMVPGASPFILTGVRQAFLRAWIAVVGAEMLAGSDWGLGWVIFDAKEFLNADVMMASLVVIGAIGFLFERLVFGSLERATVMRWGMVRAAKA